MKCNAGPIDRLIRIIIGMIIAGAGLYFESYWGILGIVVMATGIFGFCAFYTFLNINTCKKE